MSGNGALGGHGGPETGTGTSVQTVERTYVADESFELPSLLELTAGSNGDRDREIAPVVEGDPVRHRLAAVYFDTEAFDLTRSGLTLRRRTGGAAPGWQLAVSTGSGAGTTLRRPLGRGARTVPAALLNVVWARTLGAELRPVAEVVTDRTVRRLVDVTGHVTAELADDRVTARRLLPTGGLGDAATAPRSWRQIEVELDDEPVDLLAAVDAGLRERGLSEAPGTSTVVRLLDLTPNGHARPGGDGELTVASPAGDVLLAHLSEQVAQVRRQDLPVRLDAVDAVHKMRVATRRLRSALKTFEPLFEPDVVGPLREELKWLAGELGAARDAEVMRDRVRSALEEDDQQPAGVRVAAIADAELGGAYRSAHDRVLAELDGDRYRAVLTALDGLVTAPPVTDRAAAPAGEALPPLVDRSYKKVRRIVRRADAAPPGAEREELLHDARKAAKRARYAGESVSRTFGEPAVAFAAAMEEVQEALGEHQDSVLTRARLHDLARRTSSTDAAFLYGRLYALEEAGAVHGQRHFETAWKAARRKRLRRWLRR